MKLNIHLCARRRRLLFPLALGSVLWVSCTTSPLGRKQLMIVPESQMNQMGAQAFAQATQQTPISQDSKVNSYVECVVQPLTESAKGKTNVEKWNIRVLQSDQVNAFALPGGEIGVYTGILKVANTPDELATVVGHEIGHVIAKHGDERMSQQLATQGGLAIVNAYLAGHASSTESQLVMTALGLGTQVGVALPFSRTQESEADVVGLQLMAESGFDPHQAITLWQNMMKATAGQAPPEILSDHPADQKRIENLESHMNEVVGMEEKARAAGKNPHCSPP